MNCAELCGTLELVKLALASTNMVPIFQCFCFNEGTVYAYNDTIAIIGPAPFEEQFAIHGQTLFGLLSNSQAEIELSLDRDTATLKLGKTVSKLPFQDASAFIFEAPDAKWPNKLLMGPSFIDALKICSETTSKDETQVALMGITLEGSNLYSCDSDSLTRIKLSSSVKGRVLLPSAFCAAVIKLWSSLDMAKGTLYFNDEWVFADFDVWMVYGRLLEVKEPIDFEALIKKTIKSKTPTCALPDGLADALSRARVLSDPESQKTVITVSKGKVHLLTETHMGEIRDSVALKEHPDVVANVNASHIQRAIEHCDQIAFHENCTVHEKSPDIFQLVSNMS